MGLTLDIKAFDKYIDDIQKKEFPEYILKLMTDAGDMFIKDARTKKSDSEWKEVIKGSQKSAFGGKVQITADVPSFNNQTTRLRNSIGYVVSYNGKVKKSDFESYAVSGEADEEGRTLGRTFATQIASGLQGYALVCVAGADYGIYVEAKGYDVITGSILTLTQEILRKW